MNDVNSYTKSGNEERPFLPRLATQQDEIGFLNLLLHGEIGTCFSCRYQKTALNNLPFTPFEPGVFSEILD